MTAVYLGVGSNILPARHIPAAFEALSDEGLEVTASSRFYRTAPIGRPEQASYANGVWRIECPVGPFELRSRLKLVEERLGRERNDDKYAARTIDLDILLFGDAIVDEGGFVLPDPHILEREFLSAGLLEIEPEIEIPGMAEPLRSMVGQPVRNLAEYPEITAIVRKKLEMKR